ncbi:hypothetical protein QL285_002141 [Trifolium repens]|nr:hypothetical protein QL285_002141 [Trifolium repens]
MNGHFGTIQDSSRTAEMLEVAVNYFNKWVEAEALGSITAGKDCFSLRVVLQFLTSCVTFAIESESNSTGRLLQIVIENR